MDCARNIITANFSGGGTSATTAPLWQWDYGQVLCITGIDLPAAFEVHFSTNRTGGVSTVAVGADGQVTIPNDLLTIGKNLNAWIYLSDAQGEGETEYSITIPVKARPMPETYDAEATGEFDDVVRQVSEYAETAQTAADNAGASASAAAASASEAAASASAAETAKNAAETAQGKAEDAQAAAETAAQTATEKAQQTAQDAAQAAQSKADAESAAGRAEAAQTGAESAKTDAETAAQGAAASASTATEKANLAGQAAISAGQSATAAAGSATTAENAAQTATTKAGEASASATAANMAKTAAQTAQTAAETAAGTATASATTASTKAAEAAQSASGAAQSKTDAEAAATRAETAAASLTVDDALSETSENPVQNKVITGEVTQLKSAINQPTYNLNTIQVGRYQYSSNQGKVISSGVTWFGLADKFPCQPNTNYVVSYKTADNAVGRIYVYGFDANGNEVLSFSVATTLDAAFTTPAECVSFHVSIYKPGSGVSIDSNSIIQITVGNSAKPIVPAFGSVDPIARVGEIGDISITEYSGYYDATGAIIAPTGSNEVYTQKIDVSLFKDMIVSVGHSEERAGWIAYASYDANGAFIERVVVKSFTSIRYTQALTFANNVRYVSFTYRKYNDGVLTVSATSATVGTSDLTNQLKLRIDDVQRVKQLAWVGASPYRFKPCYDHLFVNSVLYIPHESLYHVRLSKTLGFNVIEANVFKTSDGVYGVNHLDSGKFGNYFKHVDGETDISNISASSVTWAWIVENVRYNTPIVKYRTRPATLEEFLSECRQQNIIPFVYIRDEDCASIVKKYMGDDNYIAYGGNRKNSPNSIIYLWQSKTTKQEIIDVCESYGKPFIYGMSNPGAFTDVELKDIVDTLHEMGYWIGTSYVDSDWYKYSYLGFDINGAQTRINRIESGNISNLDTVYGFDDFVFTNATETDGVLTYSADGTLSPDFDSGMVSVGAIDIQIEFTGTITVPSIGLHGSRTYTSTGDMPLFIATPIFNGSNALTIAVASGTVITDVKFKASKF